MKKKILVLLISLFTFILALDNVVKADSTPEEKVVVDTGYEESYLTYHSSKSVTSESSYISQQYSGESTIIVEAEFGVTPKYVMAMFLNDSTSSSFTQSTYQKAVLLGSYKGSYLYYDKPNGGEISCTDVSNLYNDGINTQTLFYAKTSFKLNVGLDGTIVVSAKLTDTLETYLSLGGTEETYNKLSKDYIELYKLENFYPESLIKNGYYIGFNVNMGKLSENNLILYHLEVYDDENGILFADNFSKYEFTSKGDNGTYTVNSDSILNQLGKGIVLTKGKEYIIPHFDVSGVHRVVSVGEEVDLSAKLVNLEGDYELTVKYDEEVISPKEGMVYVFEKQGTYKLSYVLGDVNRSLTVVAINKSTQPTVELNFSEEWNSERIESSNATIVDGKLKVTNNGSFYTKGKSEGFILNLKVSSLSENSTLSLIVGKDGENKYSLTLTDTGIKYIDYNGIETLYECKNVLENLANGEEVYIRLELQGGNLSYSAISSNEPKELLNSKLVVVKDVIYVGQVGVEVTGGELSLSVFQFVNMTSVKDDNTNTVAPELKVEEETPETPEKPQEPSNDPEPSFNSKYIVIIIVSSVGTLLLVVGGILIVKKKKRKK